MILRALIVAAALSAAAPAIAQEAAPAQAPAPAAPAPAASPAAAAPAAAATPAVAAPEAAAPTNSDHVTAPPAGKGQIVFFRPSKLTGMAIGFKVRENDVELGKLNNANYFILPVEPGKHSYVVHSEVKDILNIEVEPGETYYVAGSISVGLVAGRPNLSPSTPEAFNAAFGKLKLSSLN